MLTPEVYKVRRARIKYYSDIRITALVSVLQEDRRTYTFSFYFSLPDLKTNCGFRCYLNYSINT